MNPLGRLANFQHKHYYAVIIMALLFTSFMLVGASKIRMESDINNEFPQQLPVFQLQDEINNLYGISDSVLVVIKLDPDFNAKNRIDDIRNPFVMQALVLFEDILKAESTVDSVVSAAGPFRDQPFLVSEDQVQGIIADNPQIQGFFNKDHTATLMVVRASIGTDTEKIRKVINRFEDNKDETFIPPGVVIAVTGSPFITNVILTFLQGDAIFTTSLAAILIMFLLFILQRSVKKGLLVFVPLFLGLLWTIGTLGWLGIAISVATVGVGAMILGLGVEYGVFVVARYNEERVKNSQKEALRITVEEVGGSITGSGMTTIIGFSALTLSIMPMMQHLGQSLALGIFFSLAAALLVNPALIIMEENLEHKFIKKAKKNLDKRVKIARKLL